MENRSSNEREAVGQESRGKAFPDATPPRRSLRGHAVRGSAWTLGGYAAGQLLRFVGNLVLTRLLFPAAFGEMALISTFIQGLQMFSDVGVGPAIVQNERGDDERFLHTAWTVQVVRGVLLFLLSCAVARFLASFYATPSLAWLVPAAALYNVLAGFEATSMHSEQRHLRLERLTAVEFASQAIGTVSTVALAWVEVRIHGPDDPRAVWALVAGTLVGSSARLVLSHTALPALRHRFLLDREALRTLLGFGRWVFVSTMLGFLASQSDRLVFGKMIPLDLLGVYGIAAALAVLPTQAVQKVAGSVLFPAYSRLHASGGIAAVFARARRPMLIGGAAVVSGLAACGPLLVRILYDARYADAGWIVQILAVAAWFQVVESTNGAALLAQGRVAWHAFDHGAKLACLLVLLPLGFHLFGFRGALAGLLLADAVKWAASTVGVAMRGLRGIRDDALLTAGIAVVTSLALAAARSLQSTAHGDLAAFAAAGGIAATAWALIGVWYVRRERAARAAVAPPASA